MSDETGRLESLLLKIPYEIGAIVGAIVFILGYLLVLLSVVLFENEYVQDSLIAETGQLYYSAMFVEMETGIDPQAVPTIDGETLHGNVLLADGASSVFVFPTVFYHLIPIGVFVLGGFIAAGWVSAQTLKKGILSGLSIPVGTHFPAIVGTLLFSTDAGGPEFWHTLVLAGILLPAVFGVLGGVAAVLIFSNGSN